MPDVRSSWVRDWRVTAWGIAVWAIPFAVSVLFFDRSGQLLIARPLFKSLMVVLGGAVGAALLAVVVRRHRPSLGGAIGIGVWWLALNLALDVAVLIPMSGMSLGDYLQDIGLRYALIPVFAAALGWVSRTA